MKSTTEPLEEISARKTIKLQKIKKKNLNLVEPLPLFTLIPFLKDEGLKMKLKKIFDLDDEYMPKDYFILDNFNEIVEKKQIVGQVYEYSVKKSKYAKKFMPLHKEFLKNIPSIFKGINFEKTKKEISELISIFKIVKHKISVKTLLTIIITIFNNTLGRLSKTNKDNVKKYILRSLKLLDLRNKQLSNIDPKQTVSKETASLIKNKEDLMIDQSQSKVDEIIEDVESYKDETSKNINELYDDVLEGLDEALE